MERLGWAWIATLTMTGVLVALEWVGAIVSGSQALLADAAHVAFDFTGILLAGLLLGFSAKRPRTKQVVLTIQAALLLIAGSIFLLRSLGVLPAHTHFANPVLALQVGILGLIANLVGVFLIGRDPRMRGARFHLIGDALGSVAAVAGILVVLATGSVVWDTYAALLTASLLVVLGVRLLVEQLQPHHGHGPGHSHDHAHPYAPVGASFSLAGFLSVAGLLLFVPLLAAAPVHYHVLTPTHEVEYGTWNHSDSFELQIPAGVTRIHLDAVLRADDRMDPESMTIRIEEVVEGESGASRTYESMLESEASLTTIRVVDLPPRMDSMEEAQRIAASAPARTLVVHFEVERGVLDEALGNDVRVDFLVRAETFQPFQIEPKAPVGCPTRSATTCLVPLPF